jgi:hypothetical protein
MERYQDINAQQDLYAIKEPEHHELLLGLLDSTVKLSDLEVWEDIDAPTISRTPAGPQNTSAGKTPTSKYSIRAYHFLGREVADICDVEATSFGFFAHNNRLQSDILNLGEEQQGKTTRPNSPKAVGSLFKQAKISAQFWRGRQCQHPDTKTEQRTLPNESKSVNQEEIRRVYSKTRNFAATRGAFLKYLLGSTDLKKVLAQMILTHLLPVPVKEEEASGIRRLAAWYLGLELVSRMSIAKLASFNCAKCAIAGKR